MYDSKPEASRQTMLFSGFWLAVDTSCESVCICSATTDCDPMIATWDFGHRVSAESASITQVQGRPDSTRNRSSAGPMSHGWPDHRCMCILAPQNRGQASHRVPDALCNNR